MTNFKIWMSKKKHHKIKIEFAFFFPMTFPKARSCYWEVKGQGV